eukprot:scaffold90272_cov26-Tisochrysis_lutea.AAC.4
MANDKYERTNARITCEEAAHVYEAECCGVDAAETNFPTVKFDDDMCFLPAGTHLAQTEAFSGTKIEAVVTASECAPTLAQWQNSPQNPVGQHCAIGAFDGLNVMPILNDGTMSSLSDGAAVARAFINTELSGRTGADYSPKWYVSICEESGACACSPLRPEPLIARCHHIDLRLIRLVRWLRPARAHGGVSTHVDWSSGAILRFRPQQSRGSQCRPRCSQDLHDADWQSSIQPAFRRIAQVGRHLWPHH